MNNCYYKLNIIPPNYTHIQIANTEIEIITDTSLTIVDIDVIIDNNIIRNNKISLIIKQCSCCVPIGTLFGNHCYS